MAPTILLIPYVRVFTRNGAIYCDMGVCKLCYHTTIHGRQFLLSPSILHNVLYFKGNIQSRSLADQDQENDEGTISNPCAFSNVTMIVSKMATTNCLQVWFQDVSYYIHPDLKGSTPETIISQ